MVKIIEWSGAYQTSEWEIYKADTGWDLNSPPPQNPLFVTAYNYHLQSNSPAKRAGIFLESVSLDRDGNLHSNPPSIGVYE